MFFTRHRTVTTLNHPDWMPLQRTRGRQSLANFAVPQGREPPEVQYSKWCFIQCLLVRMLSHYTTVLLLNPRKRP